MSSAEYSCKFFKPMFCIQAKGANCLNLLHLTHSLTDLTHWVDWAIKPQYKLNLKSRGSKFFPKNRRRLFSGGRQNDFIIVASLESVSFTFNRGDCLIQVVLRTGWTVLYMMLYRYLSSYWMNSWHMVKEQIVGYSVPSQGGSVLYQWQKE